MTLILKRARASRWSGTWREEDYAPDGQLSGQRTAARQLPQLRTSQRRWWLRATSWRSAALLGTLISGPFGAALDVGHKL